MDEVQIIETSKRTEKLRGRGSLLRTKEEFQLAKGTTFLDEVVGQGAQPADVRRAFAIYGFLPLLDPKLKIPGDYKEWHFHAPNYEGTEKPSPADPSMQRGIADLRAEREGLRTTIELLRAELRKNVPHLQLYRFGAGALSLSAFSLLSWWIVGISIPFHPIFATVTIPTALGFMCMAWIAKNTESGRSRVSRNGTIS